MTKMLVEDTSLVAVADAIRTKGGTSDALVFPDGFVSAIDGIKSGENYLPTWSNESITDFTAEMLEGCTQIRGYAFYQYSGLNSVVVPNGVSSIQTNAFAECTDLKSITLSDSLSTIGPYALYKCTGLTSIVIPDSVTTISNNALFNCTGLTSLTLSNNLSYLGNAAFGGCTGLTSVVLPDSITNCGTGIFSGCTGLTSVVLPKSSSFRKITDTFFNSCSSLKSIDIPSNITSIGINTFYKSGLTSVVIPSSITSIGNYTFSYCSNLKTVEMKRTIPPTLGTGVFNNCSALTTIIVPKGTLNTYKSATNWSTYADKMVERYDLSNVSITLGGA